MTVYTVVYQKEQYAPWGREVITNVEVFTKEEAANEFAERYGVNAKVYKTEVKEG